MESPEAHRSRNPPRRPQIAETMKTYSAASLGEKAAIKMGKRVSTRSCKGTVQSSQMRHNIEASHR